MKAVEHNSLSGRMKRVPPTAAAVAVAVGALVLLGWLFDLDALKSVLPGLTAMKANTALGVILSGIALWGTQSSGQGLLLRNVSQVCAGVVLLLGLLTLGEYLSGKNFGIDQLIIREVSNLPGDIPGRMAVNTALSFSALGAALVLLSQGKGGLVVAIHALALVPIVAAGSALIGYAFDIEDFLRAKLSYTPMAANTAAAFVLLTLGIVNARPDYPFRRFMTSDSAAGITVRYLLPAAIVFPMVTGWLIQQGYHAGYFSEVFGLALFAATSIAGLATLILWNAGMLYEAAAQRERAAEELRSASQYARSLLEASLDPLITISPEGKVTDVNQATEQVTGRSRSDLIGTDFSDYFTEPDKAREGYQQVLREGSVTDYALAIRHQNGHITDVLYNASLYRDEDGNVIGVFAAARDITDRKRAEQEMRSALLYARSLLEASLDPLVTISPEGTVTDVNEATVQATGVLRRLLIGSDFSDYFTEPDKARAGYQEVFARGFVTDYPLALRHVSGKVTDVLYNASVYRDEKGGVAGVFAAARDITDRKRAEQEMRSALLYARSLLEASLDPLVTISPEGKITDVNEAAVQATGVPRRLLIGSDFSDYFTEPDKARAGYQEVFAKGFGTDYPLALRHVSGKVTDVLYNASVYRNERGEVAGVFAAARDITERKRAEQELRKYHEHLEEMVKERTQELEAANKELESFSYSVSHDLRTPLRAIDGFSNILLEDYAGKLDDEGKRLLNVVRENTSRMGHLIDDILQFSRTGRLAINVSEIDMEALTHAVLEELQSSFDSSKLQLEIGQLPPARGDRAMLRQALVNLLSNAIKFSRNNEAPRIEVAGSIQGEETVYFVKDNGVGFDMQYVDKLFGVFQRLHAVNEFEGTGIGLAIVKRIITRHGGRVWAEGKVNEGATIYFALPIKEKNHE